MSKSLSRYLVALAFAALALLLRGLLDPWLGERLAFATSYAAVAAAVWVGGWRPGLLTALVAYLAIDWFFVDPRHALGLTGLRDFIGAGVYLLASGIIIAFGTLARSARERDRAQLAALQRHIDERDRLLAVVGAAERRERKAHDRLRLALDSAGAALAECDVSNGAMVWDDEMFRLLGYEPGGIQPTLDAWRARVHPEDLEGVEAAVRGCVADGRPYEVKHRLKLADGAERWVHTCGISRPGSEGRPLTVVSVSFDITRRKVAELTLAESERALRAANAELSEADRRKDEFLAMLAHELRNPLGAIGNSVQLLRRASGEDTALALARDIIARQVTHLTRIIDDLLDVSRVTQGKIALRRERVDVGAALALGVELARAGIEARHQALQLALPPAPIAALGDLNRLAQVFANLLNNASKFSAAGAQIRVSLAVDGDEAVACVVDQGVGIRAAVLPRIFDVFVQGEQSLDRSRGGLGIGLALARALVDLHGGSIHASSAGPGRGSRFEVRLPLLPPGPPAADATVESAAVAEPSLPE